MDYMAEHLTPEGRAGIIVPEGIIFQSQNAHRQLRKKLVEDYLVAVISLPAGVFNPYSGVKTSILILDRKLAKQTDLIAFFKVENDGFDLGAQRREIEKNDLPAVQEELRSYMMLSRKGKIVNAPESESNTNVAKQDVEYISEPLQSSLGLFVEKEKIAADREWNLGGEQYRAFGIESSKYEWVELGDILLEKPQYGSGARKVPYDNKVRYVRISDITDSGDLKPNGLVSPSIVEPDLFLNSGDLLIARSGSVGRTYIHRDSLGTFQYAGYLIRFRMNPDRADSEYVYQVTNSEFWKSWILSNSKTGTLTNINAKQYSSFRFPLPPLEVQQRTVEEISDCQQVINGARAVIDCWQPVVPYDPSWPLVELGSVCKLTRGPFGGSLKKETFLKEGYVVYEQSHAISNDFTTFRYFVSESKFNEMKRFQVLPSDIIMSCSGTMGRTAILPACSPPGIINQALLKLSTSDQMLSRFLKYWMDSHTFRNSINENSYGAAIRNVASVKVLKSIKIPLPPLKTQRSIVEELGNEQDIVTNNQKLIVLMENRINSILDKVWE